MSHCFNTISHGPIKVWDTAAGITCVRTATLACVSAAQTWVQSAQVFQSTLVWTNGDFRVNAFPPMAIGLGSSLFSSQDLLCRDPAGRGPGTVEQMELNSAGLHHQWFVFDEWDYLLMILQLQPTSVNKLRPAHSPCCGKIMHYIT